MGRSRWSQDIWEGQLTGLRADWKGGVREKMTLRMAPRCLSCPSGWMTEIENRLRVGFGRECINSGMNLLS